jgi:hypothetical protein
MTNLLGKHTLPSADQDRRDEEMDLVNQAHPPCGGRQVGAGDCQVMIDWDIAQRLPTQHARQLNVAQSPGGCDDCDAYSRISASSWHHSTGGSSQLAASLEQPITQPIPPLREYAHHLPHVPIGLGDEIQGFDQIPGLFAIQCQWRPVVAVQFQLTLQTEGQDPVDLRAGVNVASTGQICELEQVAIGHVVHRDSECRCHGEQSP